MEPKKVMQCTCENCGNESEMTIKCEEVVVPEPAPQEATPPPEQAQQVKRTIVCTSCGSEADMIVDL